MTSRYPAAARRHPWIYRATLVQRPRFLTSPDPAGQARAAAGRATARSTRRPGAGRQGPRPAHAPPTTGRRPPTARHLGACGTRRRCACRRRTCPQAHSNLSVSVKPSSLKRSTF